MYQAELEYKLKQLLLLNGLSESDAHYLATYFITIEKLGDHAHGLDVFPQYLKRIQSGGFNLIDKPQILKQTDSFAVIDAYNTIGILSAKFATDIVIKNGKKSGIYTVFVRNANTYGVASYYTDYISQNNLIGITFSNTPAAMAPIGYSKKIIGTNPIAVSIPSEDDIPISFDMASSIISKSKLKTMGSQSGTIPSGYALDQHGKSTTSLNEALSGSILPFGGTKGFGIAMIIDLLSGVLSGSYYQDNVKFFNNNENVSMGVGQVFIVLDPQLIYGNNFNSVIMDYKKNLKTESQDIYIPGERKKNLTQSNDIQVDKAFLQWISDEINK